MAEIESLVEIHTTDHEAIPIVIDHSPVQHPAVETIPISAGLPALMTATVEALTEEITSPTEVHLVRPSAMGLIDRTLGIHMLNIKELRSAGQTPVIVLASTGPDLHHAHVALGQALVTVTLRMDCTKDFIRRISLKIKRSPRNIAINNQNLNRKNAKVPSALMSRIFSW